MKRRLIVCAAAVVCLSCRVTSFAQPLDDDLEPIPRTQVLGRPDPFPSAAAGADTLLTPDASATPVNEVGSSVTVITEEEIIQTRRTTVLEVLRNVPGLDVTQSGGPGGLTSVFMRGANSQQTKVMLDGIPLNDPSNAARSFDFSTLSVDNIERIEVLRGPQSLFYGSDAIGGVINIITKRGSGPPTYRATGMAGSFGTAQGGFYTSGGNERVYYSLSGSYEHTDGFSKFDAQLGGIENDRYRNGTVSARVGWTPCDLVNVDYIFRYTNVDTDIDGVDFDALADNPLRTNPSSVFYNRVQVQSLAFDGALEQKLGFNLADYNRRDKNIGTFLNSFFLGQTREVDYQADLLVTDTNVLTAGADYTQEDSNNSFSVAQRSQYYKGVYVQDRFAFFDRWFNSIGARWDDHSVAGSAFTYRGTSIFHIYESCSAVHGSIGTGFRAASLSENDPGSIFGNPNLRPETSKGWDIGWEQRLFCDRVILDATYFRNDFQDLILFDETDPFFRPFNIGRARANGVELTALWDVTCCTTISANYTFTDAVDLITQAQLLLRPKHKANLTLSRSFCDDLARLNLYFYYVGKQFDLGEIELNDYLLVNATGSIRLTCQWEAFARVDNLFDKNYQEKFGFGTAGLSVYGGLSYTP